MAPTARTRSTVAFVSSRGEILDHPRVMGFLGPEEFLEEMQRVP
jgi:hypothetical protein